MAFHVIDSRQGDADRIVAHLVQRGVPDQIASTLVPALVSSNPALRAKAEAWAEQNAVLGHDLSPEGQAVERNATNAAKAFISEAMESGDFAGEPMFKPGSRYAPSDEEIHDSLDQRAPMMHYPGSMQNRDTLARAELTERLERKHRTDVHIEDDGTVRDGAGRAIDKVTLPDFGPAPLAVSDTAPRLVNEGTTHYKDADSGEWDTTGQNRPYWLDED